MTQPVTFAQDRTLLVPAGALVRTGYVPLDGGLRFACRDRMAAGDVDMAYRRRLQLGSAQPWPPPVGQWQDGEFVIYDGRHEAIAATMLGFEYLLVAWVEAQNARVG